jgi:hypothetical protein
MVACDVIRVLTAGLIAVLGMPLWSLCTLLFSAVLFGAPFSSARSALIRDVVSAHQVATASVAGNITDQTSQIVGFAAGAAVVATVGSHRTLGIDTLSFGISALIHMTALRARPAPQRATGNGRPYGPVSADGNRIVFGDPALRAPLLFGWLAGFYILPEGLAPRGPGPFVVGESGLCAVQGRRPSGGALWR